ncbi:hypothetical protein AMECASPLE_035439 [Ameca splendens]|uniref:Secreted protein n=1 Tax=Ameca splendens TaxID=208324 RepID=A0ABV0YVD4_9TELE
MHIAHSACSLFLMWCDTPSVIHCLIQCLSYKGSATYKCDLIHISREDVWASCGASLLFKSLVGYPHSFSNAPVSKSYQTVAPKTAALPVMICYETIGSQGL